MTVKLPTNLSEWDGWCLELVDHLLHQYPEGRVLYVEPTIGLLPSGKEEGWWYHAALVLEGVVYDAWHPDVRLPPEEFVRAVFGENATWEIFGPDPSQDCLVSRLGLQTTGMFNV